MAINVKLTRILLTAAYTLARHTFLTRGRTETRIQSWGHPPQKREFPRTSDTILQTRKSFPQTSHILRKEPRHHSARQKKLNTDLTHSEERTKNSTRQKKLNTDLTHPKERRHNSTRQKKLKQTSHIKERTEDTILDRKSYTDLIHSGKKHRHNSTRQKKLYRPHTFSGKKHRKTKLRNERTPMGGNATTGLENLGIAGLYILIH